MLFESSTHVSTMYPTTKHPAMACRDAKARWLCYLRTVFFQLITRKCNDKLLAKAKRKHTCAVFSGSMSSGGGGVRDVFTAQNLQPLVQVSPTIIKCS